LARRADAGVIRQDAAFLTPVLKKETIRVKIILVVPTGTQWKKELPELEVVTPRQYISDPKYLHYRNLRVLNFCRSYQYQSTGYYVSLLARARGHRPTPSVSSIRDLQPEFYTNLVDAELEELIQKTLAPLQSDALALNIYMGRSMAKRYEKLCLRLFNMISVPLLRAQFIRTRQDKWQLRRIHAIPLSEVPEDHRPFLIEAIRDYCCRPGRAAHPKPAAFSLGMLVDPANPLPPSNRKALENFIRAGARLGIEVEKITRDDFSHLLEYDALFIRDTTQVNNHTYRFARRAEIEGMPVIDDPLSILRCTNKVYLAELMAHHHIRTPKTVIVHAENARHAYQTLGFPCILKQPDSSFSLGVVKVDTPEAFSAACAEMLNKSELIIAQEFLKSEFDWRIGVLNREPLFACKYFMADHHWQIYNQKARSDDDKWGMTETLRLEDVPPAVLRMAADAAGHIGSGLYGVDIKEIDGVPYLIEVNDNPSIDAGIEDEVLGMELYTAIMRVFRDRIVSRRGM